MIVKRKKLYEDFIEDISSDELTDEIEVTDMVDGFITPLPGATNTISIVVNEIQLKAYERLTSKNYKNALKKFDGLLVNALTRYPQISEVGPRIYNTDSPRFNAIRNQIEMDDEYGLAYRPFFDMPSSFKV